MKKLLVVLLVLTVVLVMAAGAREAAGSATNGWVVDAKCGVKGANAKAAECTKKCLGAGQKMAFVPDGTQDVLIVDNPESVKGHEGHHVAVTGQTDKEKKTIHVDSVKMMAEKSEMGAR
jgi:hypothetical protein